MSCGARGHGAGRDLLGKAEVGWRARTSFGGGIGLAQRVYPDESRQAAE